MVATQTNRNVWVLRGPRQSQPAHVRMRLMCFPMAGSGACMYHEWEFPEKLGVEVVPVELPGTNSRMKEPKPTGMIALAESVVDGLLPFLRPDQPPYALWGHSMGAWLAFEVARAPSLTGHEHNPDGNLMHRLAADDFWRVYTERYGRNPMLESAALRARLLPGLLADFALIETYTASSLEALSCGLTVFGGTLDPRYSKEQLEAWRSLSPKGCGIHWVEGGHLFVRDQQADLLVILSSELATLSA